MKHPHQEDIDLLKWLLNKLRHPVYEYQEKAWTKEKREKEKKKDEQVELHR